jgi:hypothetical protein
MYDNHCLGTALRYYGRFCKYQTPSKPMFKDDDLLKLCPEGMVDRLPADMSQDAFYKGLAKFGKTGPEGYNRVAFRIAVRMMRKHFRSLRGCHLASMEEILDSVKKDTSPGPTLKTLYVDKGTAFSDARFWQWYKLFSENMKVYGGEKSYWGACSKQELREEEKVVLGKTRVFMSGSLFLYLFMSVYCKDFNDKFYASVFRTCSCVGMSKFSGGFHYVYGRLRWVHNCGSLDASGWDTCMFNDMMWEIAQFRFDCLTGLSEEESVEAAIAMANIYHQVTKSFIMTPVGEVCSKEQGNPSGSSNTIVDNTLGHYMVKAYDWVVSVYEEPEDEDWEDYYQQFNDNVDLNLFGDDDMFSVSDEFQDLYNPSTIIDSSKEIGFVLTTESPELGDSVGLSFLSHFVRKEKNDFLVPCLPLQRLCSAAVYSSSNDVLIRAQRLSNLRYEGYYTPGWLEIIDKMINEYQKLHPDLCVKEVFDCQMSNHEIEQLYLPLESVRAPYFHQIRKPGLGKSMPRVLKMKTGSNERKEEEGSCASAATTTTTTQQVSKSGKAKEETCTSCVGYAVGAVCCWSH